MPTYKHLGLLGLLLTVGWLTTGCHEVMWKANVSRGVAAAQQGRYAEAEANYREALSIMRSLESHQPDVLNRLGAVYMLQGRYADAESVVMRSLTIIEKYRRPEYPYTADALRVLATNYTLQRKYTEAEPHYKRALMIGEDALAHPEQAVDPSATAFGTSDFVAKLLTDYARLLKETGRDAEATAMETRAQDIRAKYSKEGKPQ